jgi:vacuolar-type H+-ATPase subunit E/Vma4
MNQVTAAKILESMVAFIKQHGEEEVASIHESANNEFTI